MPQENLSTSNTVLKGGKVRPKENTTVYGTEGSKFMKTGKKYIAHRIHAAKLIASGHAVKDPSQVAKASTDYLETKDEVVEAASTSEVDTTLTSEVETEAKGQKGGKKDAE